MNSFYSNEELTKLGFLSVGENVCISKKASLYGIDNISIGNNVRIDDFCILSGKIKIGNNIHIAAGTYIYGGNIGVELKDYSCLSSRCAVYAISDDYSGEYMTNPMVPEIYRNVEKKPVYIGKHVVVGSGCTILPGVRIDDGASVGAMSLVNENIAGFTINVGIPARKIKDRSKKIIELENKFEKEKRK